MEDISHEGELTIVPFIPFILEFVLIGPTFWVRPLLQHTAHEANNVDKGRVGSWATLNVSEAFSRKMGKSDGLDHQDPAQTRRDLTALMRHGSKSGDRFRAPGDSNVRVPAFRTCLVGDQGNPDRRGELNWGRHRRDLLIQDGLEAAVVDGVHVRRVFQRV
jgi:hypothetical protein